MKPSASTERQTENPLRLAHCMRCGYSFETLPAEGICPECGLAYDQQTVVLYGEARNPGWSAGGILGRGMLVAACLAAIFWTIGLIRWFRTPQGMLNLLNCSICMGPLILAFMWRVLARQSTNGGLLQVRMNAFGCVECDLPEETVGGPDIQRLWIWIAPMLWIAWAAIGIATRQTPWVVVVVLTLLVVAVVVSLHRAWRRHRRAAEADVLGNVLVSSARVRGVRVAPIGWQRVERIDISEPLPACPSGRRIVVRQRGFLNTALIDAEVECSEEQAAELWNRSMAWINAKQNPRPSERDARRSAERRSHAVPD